MDSIFLWLVLVGMVVLPTLPFPAIVIAYNRMLQHKLEKISRTIRGEHFREFTQYFRTTITGPVSLKRPDKQKQADIDPNQTRVETITEHFYMFYHWHIYAFPVGITMALVALSVVTLMTKESIIAYEDSATARFFVRFPPSFFFGVLGAYLWGLYDMLVRYRSMDLTPSSIHFVWLRMLVAGVLGYIVSLGLMPDVAIAVAFGIGVFPLQTLQRFVTERAQRSLQFGEEEQPAEKADLHKLQGASRTVINRLGEEGIDSVEHLAFADPINLLLRTSIEWKVLLDLIDQAVLYAYVGDKIDALRLCGIRGAMEASGIGEDLFSSDDDKRQHIAELLNAISNKVDLEECMLKHMFISIADDLHVQFIWSLWAAQHEEYTIAVEE